MNGVVAAIGVLSGVLSVGFDDLDGADLLSRAVLAVTKSARVQNAEMEQNQLGIESVAYHLKTLPYEPLPVSSRNS
jgi:hypothetical protein